MKRYLGLICPASLVLAGCASTITAIKGRSFGDHPLKTQKLYVATGDRRFAFDFPDGKVCVEPQPELSVTISAKSDPTLTSKITGATGDPSSDKSLSFQDEVSPTGTVTTTRSEKSDIFQHAVFAICMAYQNRILDKPEASRRLNELLSASNAMLRAQGKTDSTDDSAKNNNEKLKAINANRAKLGEAPLTEVPDFRTDQEKLGTMNAARAAAGLPPLSALPSGPHK